MLFKREEHMSKERSVKKENKIDKTVIRETMYIAAWMLILSAITQAIFLIIGFWNISVLLGNVLSAIAGIGNFFLMGLTVQSALGKDEKDAKQAMRASSLMRNVLLFAIVVVGVLVKYFSTWTVIIPLFFPRIAVAFRPLFDKKMGTVANTAQTVTEENAQEETTSKEDFTEDEG